MHIFGSSGKLLVGLGIIGYLFGSCVTYYVVVGDLGPQIISRLFDISISDSLRYFLSHFTRTNRIFSRQENKHSFLAILFQNVGYDCGNNLLHHSVVAAAKYGEFGACVDHIDHILLVSGVEGMFHPAQTRYLIRD